MEHFGPGLERLSIADRASWAKMSPEYGATKGCLPMDGKTLDFLRITRRIVEKIGFIEAYLIAN